MQTIEIKSGWPTFAGVVGAVVGGYNILSGIAAVSKDDVTEALHEVLFGIDISVWGWFWLILGISQVVSAWLIFKRHELGQMMGITLAAASAFFTVFLVFVAPLWALTVLLLDVLVIYGLTNGWERERTID